MTRNFRYVAVNSADTFDDGTIEACDVDDATRQLLDRGLYPLQVSGTGPDWMTRLNRPLGAGTLSRGETTEILADLGRLVKCGVEVVPSLVIMASSASKPRVRRALSIIVGKLRSGATLAASMSDGALAFPLHVIAAIRASELSPALGDNLLNIANGLQRTAALRKQIATALIYPACVAVAMIGAIVILVWVVVPTLESIIGDATHQLPWQTRVLITVGWVAREQYWVLLAIVGAIIVTVVYGLIDTQMRGRLERWSLRVPIIGQLLVAIETAHIARLLAMLMSARLPLANVVEYAAGGARLVTSREALTAVRQRIREGTRVHEALAEVPTLSARVIAMIAIGESIGQLDTVLAEAADDSERRVAVFFERMLALLTPTMTLAFGGMAGFVLYAVMTSILSVNELTMPRP